MIKEMVLSERDKEFGAFIIVNTTECEAWTEGNRLPCIQSITEKEDFYKLGVDFDGYGDKIVNLKVGESLCLLDVGEIYEGVYIIRVA